MAQTSYTRKISVITDFQLNVLHDSRLILDINQHNIQNYLLHSDEHAKPAYNLTKKYKFATIVA